MLLQATSLISHLNSVLVSLSTPWAGSTSHGVRDQSFLVHLIHHYHMTDPTIFHYFISRGIKLSKVNFMIQLPFCSIDKCCRSKDNSCCTWPAELTPYGWLQPEDRSVQHQSPVLHCDLYMSIDEIVKVSNNSILLIKGFPFQMNQMMNGDRKSVV